MVVPPERVLLPPYYPDTPKVRRDVARVYCNVAVMDRQVGELLAELEEAGVADDTIVIFYSDNGGPSPAASGSCSTRGSTSRSSCASPTGTTRARWTTTS